MALMNNQWQKVGRRDRGDDGVLEYFMKGEFITSDKWKQSNPPDFPKNNPYLKDCFYFNNKKYEIDIKNEIRVSEFIHVTLCLRAVSIIKDSGIGEGFRPGTKNMPGIGDLNLIWFGLKVEEKQIDSLRRNYNQCAYDQLKCHPLVSNGLALFVANTVADESANTTPFQPMSRYGNVKFTLSITEVLSQYKRQFCANGDVMMRKLGTFAYRMETMHVVLVCRPSDSLAHDLPALDSDDPIIIDDEEIFTWRPHSIGENYISFQSDTPTTLRYGYPFNFAKRWEHVTFAFVVPNGHCLYIPHLDNHVSLCLHLTKEFKIFCIHNAIFNMLYWIQREEKSDIRQKLANMLIFMIYFNCEEWPLYQKTVSVDMFNKVRGDLTVQDEWITSSFKAMLPMEVERLIWPYPKKMNGLSINLNSQ